MELGALLTRLALPGTVAAVGMLLNGRVLADTELNRFNSLRRSVLWAWAHRPGEGLAPIGTCSVLR